MGLPTYPQIRPLEMIPHGNPQEGNYVLRDPQGLANTVVVPPVAALLISLMNGKRSLGDIRREFQEVVGQSVPLNDIESLVHQLDQQYLLKSERFAQFAQQRAAEYSALAVRPAAHAGTAYPAQPTQLRQHLGTYFTNLHGPGMLPTEGHTAEAANPMGTNGTTDKLCGVMSPHIDFQRGGTSFAWAYDRIVTDSQARLFLVLGTAHTPLKSFFSVSSKDFETPLGNVRTDRTFVNQLRSQLGEQAQVNFTDELPHRQEHSIEFQALMLQFALGSRRDFAMVPILVGSFHCFVQHKRLPQENPAVAEFIDALRTIIAGHEQEVCVVAGVDMAHIGPHFGDPDLLDDERLKSQWADDQQLLSKACQGDSGAWFSHISQQADSNRICGLAPMYTLLEVLRPRRGELLKYEQAVADDRTSCVSFAAAAFYR